MAEMTVEQLARIVGISPVALLTKLKDAGIPITDVQQTITEGQRKLLLRNLKESKEETDATLTLKKKVGGSSGKSMNVTILKRRVLYDGHVLPENEELVVDEIPKEEEKLAVEEKQEELMDTTPEKSEFPKIQEEVTTPRKGGKVKSKKSPTSYKKKDTSGEKERFKERKPVKGMRKEETGPKPVSASREVVIPETLTVAELAQRLSVKAAEVIKVIFSLGTMVTINQSLDQETAVLVAEELGFTVKLVKETLLEDDFLLQENVDLEKIARAPVVTIMGHVDHGKTSLLDFIRRTKVSAGEAGGITQHIGAYRVKSSKGEITFLDTPGHEAFTAMRARGAQCTDIVVLVVAADDGVMPQTVEAIKHAQAAQVPLIVAINKIDKPEADPERIKTELTKYKVIPEAWGGDTMFQEISAKQGIGIEELLDSILVLAEVLELRAPVNCAARGVVLEAHLDKGYGPVASVLVQQGTLKQGDILLAGLYYGKIRAMLDDLGCRVAEVFPSFPAEILGLSGIPSAGDEFVVTSSEKRAREVALFRQGKYRDVRLAKRQAAKLENLLTQMKTQEIKTLGVVLKADTQGSLEAITEMLNKIVVEEIKVSVIASGVGGITETDINLALASKGIVVGFNVRADAAARVLAEREGVDLRYYSVIYKLSDDIHTALSGMLAPVYEEQVVGFAQVREIFRSSKFGVIAGCMVVEGMVKRGASIRLLRDNVVIYEGEIESLRRGKDDVSEVKQGIECGIGVKNYDGTKVGDQIEVYKTTLVKRTV